MKCCFETASALVGLLSGDSNDDFDPAWSSFMSETSGKMELIKGIKWDPTNDVDKEIHDMQVKNYLVKKTLLG